MNIMSSKLKGLFYFAVTFTFAGGALFVAMNNMGLFEVGTVPVEIVTISTEPGRPAPAPGVAEIRLRERFESALRSLKGKRIWEIDIGAVRASLARDEWVKDVLISRSFPNDLRVIVRPKTAVTILISKNGSFIPVTEEGALLAPLRAGVLPDVPILRGEIFAGDRAKRMEIAKFLGTMPTQGPLTARNISEIGWSSEDGYILTLIHPKIEVKLGEDRVELKALRIAQVMNYLSANNLKGRVIDASFSKKVLVRLRKGP